MPVDPRAAQGFSATAALYDRVRPAYPIEAVRTAAVALGVGRTSTVLDLAAGTGKLTVLLDAIAGRVIAVDPSPLMLDVLRARLPGVRALDGEASAIPLPDRSVDAIFVGEALHWFDLEQAAPELARVLRPDGAAEGRSSGAGGLALLWNRLRLDEETDPRVQEVRDLLQPYREAAGPFPAEGAERWGALLVGSGRFSAPRRIPVAAHEQTLPADDFVALASTWSWVVNLDPEEQATVLMAARRIVGGRPVTLTYDVELWTVSPRRA